MEAEARHARMAQLRLLEAIRRHQTETHEATNWEDLARRSPSKLKDSKPRTQSKTEIQNTASSQ